METRQNNNSESVNRVNTPAEEKEPKGKKRLYGQLLILAIVIFISFQYYVFTYEIMWKTTNHKNVIFNAVKVLVFHVLVFMLLWSLIVTMNTHPGEIPLYWGFYIGDEDYKRKRYCLICNAFKPERSHHCSVCNICVLNMDHHCPWVNNCIGFYNRKFFMQLLFYVCLTTWFIDITLFQDMYVIGMDLYKEQLNYKNLPRACMLLSAYAMILTLTVLITLFFRFHVSLVFINTTTIESLDKQNAESNKKFCLTSWENWIQVFGENKCLWFLPLVVEVGRPKGDGLNWKTTSFIEPPMEAINNLNRMSGGDSKLKSFHGNEAGSGKETELQRNPFFNNNLKYNQNNKVQNPANRGYSDFDSSQQMKNNFSTNNYNSNPFSPQNYNSNDVLNNNGVHHK